jgi:hypothetical protein
MPRRLVALFMVLGLLGIGTVWAQGTDTVATLKDVQGSVQVARLDGKVLPIREGQFVQAGEEIRTSAGSRATLELRDGSRVRIYASTNFLVEDARERNSATRSFRAEFELKRGVIQGRFKPRYQLARIRTPVATIGIRGTSLRLGHANRQGTTVGLYEGLIEIDNTRSTTLLEPGNWIPRITASDEDLTRLIVPLPQKLFLKTEEYEIEPTPETPTKIFLSIQWIDSVSEQNIRKRAPVLLESDYPGVRLDSKVQLDSSGFIRIPVFINAPLKGVEPPELIRIHGIVDDPKVEDVGEGVIVLKWKNANNSRRFLLDPTTDELERLK